MIRHTSLAIALALSVSTDALARDGDLDPSFGVGGKDLLLYFGGAYIYSGNFVSVAQQSSGNLIVSATLLTGATNGDFAAMRLLPDGSVDPTFGNFGSSGAAVVAFDRSGSTFNDVVQGVVVQPDDKIVLAGYVDGDSTTGIDMGIVRLNADGYPDPSFGSGGMTTVAFNLGTPGVAYALDDFVESVSLQTDGKILLAGGARTSTTNATLTQTMAIARLNGGNGQRDGTFNVDGRVTVSFGGDIATAFGARQLADQSHILVVGGAYTVPGVTNADFALAKFDANGNLDPSFGVGGKTTFAFDVGGGKNDAAFDFVELPSGALFVCGTVDANTPSNSDFGCMRFLANGTPDPAFAPVLIPFDLGGDLADIGYRMTQDALGRLLVVGLADGPLGDIDFAMARLFPDGTLDASFGVGGTAIYTSSVPPAPDRVNGATGVLIEPDGRIVVAGLADSDGSSDYEIELVRLIGDTIFDDRFGR
jgi:uncharacterized delta-60 repeat protein